MAYVEKRGHGNYRVRYRTPAGEWVDEKFTRRRDADRRATNVDAELERGEWLDRRRAQISVGDFYAEVYRPTMINLDRSTRARDESYWRTHIEPAFRSVPLAAVDYAMCQAWVNELSTRRAPATVVKAAQILGKVLKVAIRDGRLRYNAMAEVTLPRIDDAHDRYLTPAEVATLAEAMTSSSARFRALVFVGCYCGPRIGELLALRWSDVDLLHRRLSITRTVLEVTGEGLVEGSTKTKAGRRTVTIPRLVVAELERHRDTFGGHELVFTTTHGRQVRANNWRRREWAHACVAAGLGAWKRGEATKAEPDGQIVGYEGLTPHDMRHTAVSLWVAAGASDVEVAKWAGHTSAAFTKSRYAHLFPEHGEALADRLDGFIATATSTPAAPVIGLA